MALEYVCLYSLVAQLRYRNTKLDTVFNLRSTCDKELKPAIVNKLIRFFVFYSYLAGLTTKFFAIALSLTTVYLLHVAVILFVDDQLDLIQFLIGVFVCVSIQKIAFAVLFIVFTLLMGLFFIVKIFQHKMDRCLFYLKQLAVLKSQRYFNKFFEEYIKLHDNLTKYNRTAKEYIFSMDFGCKFLTSSVIIYITKQKDATPFSYFFLSYYMVAYAFDLVLHLKLSKFQNQNESIYKYLSSHCCRMKWQFLAYYPSHFRYHLKLMSMTEFVADNRMGIKNGREYVITKEKMVFSVLYNVYMILMMSKKIKL